MVTDKVEKSIFGNKNVNDLLAEQMRKPLKVEKEFVEPASRKEVVFVDADATQDEINELLKGEHKGG